MNKRSLWIQRRRGSGACSRAGRLWHHHLFCRTQPAPQRLPNRVLIAIQNPSAFAKGALQIVDAYYDIRSGYNRQDRQSFSITGYSGALPITIQNMPEEQLGAVYGSGDGSFTSVNYAKENTRRHPLRA